ncbi:MAG: peptidase M20 [Candidatus Marinimicrobia bacterium]|nr:peptidase M20 [Candidatus Neomarinimicrobiota bacterium]
MKESELAVQTVARFAAENHDGFLEELKDLIRIPSISSSTEHKGDVERCAQFTKKIMLEIGLEKAEIWETDGHPIVYGEWLGVSGKPTVLIYGHYDVQPVDPLDLWETPPFEPSVRNGKMYGRGSVDDKGQVHVHLKAVESWLKEAGALPVNLKFLIEGEEEVGSKNLNTFLKDNRQMLAADVVLISDTSMIKKGIPSICCGLRGLAYFQIDLRGSGQDLHSGSFGGAVKNPIHALTEIINQLKDEKGRITIPGFYDDVVELAPDEEEALAKLPFDQEDFRKEIGAAKLYGEEGFSVLENLWARPALDVCGIWGGFTGEGSKTVIPAEAHAKVSMRLVSNQDPETVATMFEDYIRKITPPEVELSVQRMHGGLPFLADTSHPAFEASVRALKRGFDSDAVFIREGGSIPFVQTLNEVLNVPIVMVGFGLPDENAHAPNEWFDMENYEKGILSSIYLYDELSRI